MGYGQGWAPPSSPGGSGGSVAGPLVVGGTTTVASGAYQMLSTDSLIRVQGGPTTITLGSVSLAPGTPGSGIRDGQRVTIVSFDSGGDAIAIVPTAGDNINGGSQFNLGEYGAFLELQARNAGIVTNWVVVGMYDGWDTMMFPLQPALAAGAQGPLSLGTLFIPQGPRFLHSIWVGAPAALTAGSLSVVVTGPSGGPRTVTLSSPGPPTQATGTLFNPGNANELTVPIAGASAGAIFTATVSTVAAFAPAMACPCVLLKFWA
jgi:hypothetical protein